jgi:hypothetical protein
LFGNNSFDLTDDRRYSTTTFLGTKKSRTGDSGKSKEETGKDTVDDQDVNFLEVDKKPEEEENVETSQVIEPEPVQEPAEQDQEQSEEAGGVAQRIEEYLKVTVISAIIEKKQDLLGDGDPFIVLRFNSEEQKTTVKKNTKNPEWNESLIDLFKFHLFLLFFLAFTFKVPEGIEDKELIMEIWDQDSFNKNDLIGGVSLDIDEHKNQNEELTLGVLSEEEVVAQVKINIFYEANVD